MRSLNRLRPLFRISDSSAAPWVAVGLGLSLLSVTATYGAFAWRDVPSGRLLGGVAMCLVVGVGLTVAGAAVLGA